MANTITNVSTTPPAPGKRRWLRILGWLAGVFLVLLVVLYFVATSSAFFKGVILPRVSASMNAKVTVSDASLSPFHSVVLKDLKVETTGAEPLVTAPEVRLRYSLMDIIGGNIHVDELTLSSPTITLVQNPDDSSNLDPILKAQNAKPAPPAQPPAKPSKPAHIDIKKIALTDATIRQVKLYAGNNRDTTELSHLNVTVDDVKNGQSGKLTMGTDIAVQNNPPAPGASGTLQARLDGGFTFALTPDLKPGSVQGNTKLTVTKAEGALAQASAFGANLDCDVTPAEIKQVALRFQKGDTRLGELLVTGPFDMQKTEGILTITLLNIDKNLLNLAGTASGLDFGPTTINSTNQVQLAKGGTAITATGQFNLNQLQVTRANQTTPPLNLGASYDISVDPTSSNALVRALSLTGAQSGNQFLRGELSSPMNVSWGNTANAVGDSALNITVTHFNLADWKPFLGDVAPAGDVNGKLQILSQQAGKKISLDLSSEVANLTAGSGSNQITQATVTFAMRGQVTDLKQANFPEYKFTIARQGQPLVTAGGSLAFDQVANSADVQFNAQLMLARLLQAFPQAALNLSSGTADLKLHIVQTAQAGAANGSAGAASQNITGTFELSDFTGLVGSNNFRSFGATADLDVAATPLQVQIRKIAGKITEGTTVGGSFDMSGSYDLTNKTGQLTAKLAGFNPTGLHTFLDPMLGDKKLVSVALNASASAQYNPQGASTVKADLTVTNLVVNDPKGQIPAKPLEARIVLDASANKQVADVRQFQVSLTPTARGTNQVQLTAHLDMSDTNALQGNVKLAADSLDLTTYYDLFGGQKAAAGTAKPATPDRGTPSSPAQATTPSAGSDLATNQLPLRNFVAEATVGRLYLREVDIANFQLTTKIDGGHVVVNPFKFALNGAPVNSTVDLDMGVPGYKYDVAFSAQAIPLAPLVNTFQPEHKGLLSGSMTGQAKIAGVGRDGTALQKSLIGSFDMTSTNLNLVVDNLPNEGVATKVLKVLVDAISTLPDLVKNPAGGLGSLAQGLTSHGGGSSDSSGTSATLKKSPVNAILLHGTAGSGQVVLQQAVVQSPSFEAQLAGTVTLAPVLTNSSLQLPVSVSLERSVADKLKLAGDTPTNAMYAKLPDFLAIEGTAGDPKKKVNPAPLLAVALQALGGKGGQVGNALQQFQGLLGGKGATNAPGTNHSSNKLGGLLQGLGGLGAKPSAGTNAPAPGTAKPATNQSPVGELLDLFGPKKK